MSQFRPGGLRGGATRLAAAVMCVSCEPALEHDEGEVETGPGEVNEVLADHFLREHGVGLGDVRWGDLHSHSTFSYDGRRAVHGPVEALAFAADPDRGDLDFVALSEHAEWPPEAQLPPGDADLWQSLLRVSREGSQPGEPGQRPFVVFPAWEYTNTPGLAPLLGSGSGYGHKVVLLKDTGVVPPTRTGAWGPGSGTDLVAATATGLWANLAQWRPPTAGAEGGALTIPHATSMSGAMFLQDHRTDWSVTDPDFVRHVELLSKWGTTEGPPPPDAACELDDSDAWVDFDPAEHDPIATLRTLLHRVWVREGDRAFRLAFVGGTDNHAGEPGNWTPRQAGTGLAIEHRGGVTGIVSTAVDRDSLWSALWAGRTLAAHSGPVRPRLLVAAETGGEHVFMGGAAAHDGEVRIRALAGEEVRQLDVVLDGCLRERIEGSSLDRVIPLSPGRHFVYVRARTEAGDAPSYAWSSPIYLEARPEGDDASILSAYLGLTDANTLLAAALSRISGCEQRAGDDAMPVVFSAHLDPLSIEPGDFRVRSTSGAAATPSCATLAPADDLDERRTVLLTGELGRAADLPARVDLVGEVTMAGPSGEPQGRLADVSSPPVRRSVEGPIVVLAIHWRAGAGSRCADGSVRVQTTWSGGVSARLGREFGPDDLDGFVVQGEDVATGRTRSVVPVAFEDLDDGDNHLDLCIPTGLVPRRLEVAAAVAFDPTLQPNPASSAAVELR
jgi:hypothetical protein